MLAFDTVAASAGGVGVFLVGMLTMTGALRDLAGNRMHRMLSRWTTTTMSGVATGTLCTALLQYCAPGWLSGWACRFCSPRSSWVSWSAILRITIADPFTRSKGLRGRS